MKSRCTLFLWVFALSLAKPIITKAQVNVQDSLALVALYNSTDGPNWKYHDNWLTDAPASSWYGVIIVENRVFGFNLGDNNLKGSIPPELGKLTGLNWLYLYNNQLTGSIPPELGLTEIHWLLLYNNQLTGNIPPELGNLNLHWLELQNNQLTGSIPLQLGKLKHLDYLFLNNNKLTGSIPLQLGKLKNLRRLILNNNQLTGKIPATITNLSFIGEIDLSNNQLSGSIPPELGNFSSLTTLNLKFNQLSGSIPSGLGNLQNIGELNLSHNNLTETIPASFSNLTKLRKLNVTDNRLSGAVPSFLTTLSNLRKLYLLRNHFTFDGFETLVQHDFDTLKYDVQRKINIHQTGNALSVYAGGTLSNNTYKWFKDDALVSTINGDSTFTPTAGGAYTVQVTNSVATALTLRSDTVNYAAIKGLIASQTSDLITDNKNTRISVYPNPAKTSVTVAFNTTGNYTIQLTDLSGRVLQTKTGNAINGKTTIQLIVAGYTKGIYLITVSNDKNQNQSFRINKE